MTGTSVALSGTFPFSVRFSRVASHIGMYAFLILHSPRWALAQYPARTFLLSLTTHLYAASCSHAMCGQDVQIGEAATQLTQQPRKETQPLLRVVCVWVQSVGADILHDEAPSSAPWRRPRQK